MDFFSDTGVGLGAEQGPGWSGLTFAVVDEMTGIVIDTSVTGPDGRATLDGQIDAPFFLVAEATGSASRSYRLAREDVLVLWVAADVGSAAPVPDAPSLPVVTDLAQPAVADAAGVDVLEVGTDPRDGVALTLPNPGVVTETGSSIVDAHLLATLLLGLACILGATGIELKRRT